MITISNDKLSVSISEKGAELQSVQYNSLEYLWQAKAAWTKHSPVLFPVIGELKDGKYIFENKEYKMSRHGFAWNKIFKASQASGTSAIFTLTSDEETLAIYPFSFIFKVEYKLEDSALLCTYVVENTDRKLMYFSVGGHPAFNVPLQSNLRYSDYSLKFNSDSVLKRYVVNNGLIGDDTETILLHNNELQLEPSLFYADAIVLKHIASNQVELFSLKDEHGLKVTFDDFSYLGIWAAKDAPFVCIEPWCGVADNLDHNYQLRDKEGIIQLAVDERWQKTWTVELY